MTCDQLIERIYPAGHYRRKAKYNDKLFSNFLDSLANFICGEENDIMQQSLSSEEPELRDFYEFDEGQQYEGDNECENNVQEIPDYTQDIEPANVHNDLSESAEAEGATIKENFAFIENKNLKDTSWSASLFDFKPNAKPSFEDETRGINSTGKYYCEPDDAYNPWYFGHHNQVNKKKPMAVEKNIKKQPQACYEYESLYYGHYNYEQDYGGSNFFGVNVQQFSSNLAYMVSNFTGGLITATTFTGAAFALTGAKIASSVSNKFTQPSYQDLEFYQNIPTDSGPSSSTYYCTY